MKLLLAKLINELSKERFLKTALDVSEILDELLENELENEVSDANSIVNVVGLRGDVTPEQPIGGFSEDPFFYRTI